MTASPRPRPTAPPGPSPLDCVRADFLAQARIGESLPSPTEPEIAFAGRSNVGKSTLLNRLCQRHSLARTSKTPGCTRGVILYGIGLRDGTRFVLADLPGYGFAERSHGERTQWGPLIEGYIQRRGSIAGVVILVDARRGLQDEELQLIEWLEHIHRRYALVLTKIDKLSAGERGRAVAAVRASIQCPVVAVSAQTGHGREELLRLVAKLARWEDPAQPGTPAPGSAENDPDRSAQ